MKKALMLIIDVGTDDELVEAIDAVMNVSGVSEWTADALTLSPDVYRGLRDRGHAITRHKRAQNWKVIAKASSR
jgi:hypothetical protein